MGMPVTQTHWTVDMVHALPDDGKRHEIIDGELLVTPAPSAVHQTAVLRLSVRLTAYLDQTRAGCLFLAPGDVIFGDRTLVQPDLFVTPLVHGRRPTSWQEAPRPLLHVEVVSPNSARYDRGEKRDLYQRQGIPEYWIVDPDSRLLERWRPRDERPEIVTGRLEWHPDGTESPFVLDLSEYWAEVFDE